jgi:hypothetical protein
MLNEWITIEWSNQEWIQFNDGTLSGSEQQIHILKLVSSSD